MGLSVQAKVVFEYIRDNCDNAGVWEPNYRLANFCINADVEWDRVIEELGDRLKKLEGGKFWIPRFIKFQYLSGECTSLKPASPPHAKIIRLLESHGIDLNDAWITGPMNGTNGHTSGHIEKPVVPRTMELNGLEKPKVDRQRDLVFEELCKVCGQDMSRLTGPERGKKNKALMEIRKVEPDVTPERIRLAARNWREEYPKTAVTDMAIAGNWTKLTPAPVTKEMAAAKEKRREELRENMRKLETFKDPDDPIGRFRDLTDEERIEVNALQVLIEAQKKAL